MVIGSATARLKAIDFYRKIPRDLTEASLSGAGLSIVAAIAMTFLFGMELANYLAMSTSTTVIVDQSPDGDLLRINFNFSFPALSCEFASVDVNDVLGTARFNLSKTVRKFPIDTNYQVVGPQHHPGPVPTPKKPGDDHPVDPRMLVDVGEEAGSLVLTDQTFDAVAAEFPILLVNFFAPWCPWCRRLEPAWEKAATLMLKKYNPQVDGRIRLAKVDCTIYQQLCRKSHIQGFPSIRIFRKGNDIRELHGQHDHESYYGERDTESLVAFAESLVPVGTIQQEHGRELEEDDPHKDVRRKAPQSSGCNIEGFILVKKVPGNLMVSAHSGAHSFDPSSMNMTHWVHHVSFGRPLTRRRQDALVRLLPYLPDNQARISNHFFKSSHDNVTHDHFLQVVLTEVEPLHPPRDHRTKGQALQSYDYTVHSHVLQSPKVPVARFHYELSPMQILIKENRRSFWHFITNVCAIVGGVFTVAGILDSVLHSAAQVVKKVRLGKQF